MTPIIPILFGIVIIISILLTMDIHKKHKEYGPDYFALVAILFFLGFIALGTLEYTGLVTQEVITGLIPTSQAPEDFSLVVSGIMILLSGFIIFLISKRKIKQR